VLRSGPDSGFTLLEVMIAILVLSVGVLGLASTMAESIAYMNMSQEEFIAQQKAAQGMETVFFARDSKLYPWSTISNVSNGGMFLDGPQPLLHAGANGIVGTAQDVAANPDVIIQPGPDGLLGTADDIKIPLSNFTRQVIFSNINGQPNLRKVEVIIRYQAARFRRQYTLTSYVSAFS
jgi:prepilin-type N-terminal cleavage/methylation domain-containing protein